MHGGSTEEDVKARIQKSQMWKAKQIKLKTKLKIFNSNVKSVSLFGSETWRIKKINKKNMDLHQQMPAPNLTLKMDKKVFNTTLWERTKQLQVENEIKKERGGG